jgi:(2Fe-2S) ferredoxin
MEVVREMPYRKHVLVCVNERGGRCCKGTGSNDIFLELKKWVMENGLTQDVWVTATKCLGFCNDIGATIVVYPDKLWFLRTKMEELDKVKGVLQA